MTGTAATEAAEFWDIYKMNVVDDPDQRAGAADRRGRRVLQEHRRTSSRRSPRRSARSSEIGQPVLVGTVSIEKSELLSEFLDEGRRQARGAQRPLPRDGGAHRRPGGPARRGDDRHQHGRPRHRHPARRQRRVPHRGRARGHARGARARRRDRSASRPRSPPSRRQVLEAGGLFVLGTERHESRRIDNQLRGRSGRQGDPGLSAASTCASRTTCCASSGPTRCSRKMMNSNLADGEAIGSQVAVEGDRDRAEEGRGAQLRHPQAGRRIRRRDERPAQGDLRAARRHHGRRGGRRRGRSTCATTRSTRWSARPARRAPIPSSGTSPGSRRGSPTCSASSRRSRSGWRRTAVEPEMIEERLRALADDDDGSARSPRPTRASGGRSKRASCSSGSTTTGRSTSRRSTRCARWCSCAPMRRRRRSTSTSRKRSGCSSACSRRSART